MSAPVLESESYSSVLLSDEEAVSLPPVLARYGILHGLTQAFYEAPHDQRLCHAPPWVCALVRSHIPSTQTRVVPRILEAVLSPIPSTKLPTTLAAWDSVYALGGLRALATTWGVDLASFGGAPAGSYVEGF